MNEQEQIAAMKVLVDDRVPGYRGRMKLHPTWNIEYVAEEGNAK